MVTFARAGLTVAFDESAASLLEMAEACDVPTRWSCRTGVCHTCSTPLLAGAVEYSPPPLTEPDDGEALLCCARPLSDVVLDL
jgi:ferredoxin